MRKIIIIVCSLIVLVLICICFSSTITEFYGSTTENCVERTVSIKVKNKRIDQILKKMSGNVTIEYENDVHVYDFSGNVYDHHEECNIIDLIGFVGEGENADFAFGRMFFDDDLRNIVIIVKGEELYAADQEFIKMVRGIITNSK